MLILPIINSNLNNKKNSPVNFSGKRVDKGLERFSDYNKDRMPLTLRRYTDALEDKNRLTPLEAQRRAFIKLKFAQNVKDIKDNFDEPLFKDLKDPADAESSSRMLMLIKKLTPVMEDLEIAPLKSKENLTVYLVKKIFLEAKTMKEINEDMENDLDDLFKSEFKESYPNTPYVSTNVLNALGIKLLDKNFFNSLKFTREGYSDEFGELSRLALQIYYESLSQEQREALAKKSTARLENWWNSLSTDKKLEMAAEDEYLLKMQSAYNDYKIQNLQPSQTKSEKPELKPQDKVQITHTKTGSQVFSSDDLFKRWAANKIALYKQGLTEEEKSKLREKQTLAAINRWAKMTPAEKAEQISRMKSGSEKMRYALIDAWNRSADLAYDLSDFLSEKQVEKPLDALYSKEALSVFMSQAMTEFWTTHEEEAKRFGVELSNALKRVDIAIAEGRFEYFKSNVTEKRKLRIFDFNRFRQHKAELAKKSNDELLTELPQTSSKPTVIDKKAVQELIKSKKKQAEAAPKCGLELATVLHRSSSKLLIETAKIKDPEVIREIFRNPKYNLTDVLSPEQIEEFMKKSEPRVYAFLHVVNELLKDNVSGFDKYKFFELSDVEQILPQLSGKPKTISFVKSTSSGTETVKIKIHNYNFNEKKAIKMFEDMVKPLNEQEVQQIMKKYFPKQINGRPSKMSEEKRQKVENYLRKYGIKFFNMVFDENAIYPSTTQKIYYYCLKHFIDNKSPDDIQGLMDSREYQQAIKNRKDLLNQMQFRYSYLPSDFLKTFLSVGLGSLGAGEDEFKNFLNYNVNAYKVSGKHPCNYDNCKDNMTLKEKLSYMAMEKALADVLYQATKNEDVFNMDFEDLNSFAIVGKENRQFPTTASIVKQHSGVLKLILLKKPALNLVAKKYEDYLEDCQDWYENIQTDATLSKEEKTEELMCILNPDENWKNGDRLIQKRIQRYKIEQDL